MVTYLVRSSRFSVRPTARIIRSTSEFACLRGTPLMVAKSCRCSLRGARADNSERGGAEELNNGRCARQQLLFILSQAAGKGRSCKGWASVVLFFSTLFSVPLVLLPTLSVFVLLDGKLLVQNVVLRANAKIAANGLHLPCHVAPLH